MFKSHLEKSQNSTPLKEAQPALKSRFHRPKTSKQIAFDVSKLQSRIDHNGSTNVENQPILEPKLKLHKKFSKKKLSKT